MKTLLTSWVDAGVRYILVAVISSLAFMGKWGLNTEQRVHDLEAKTADIGADIAGLSATAETLQGVRTDLAVVQAHLAAQRDAQGRIEAMLTRLVRPGR